MGCQAEHWPKVCWQDCTLHFLVFTNNFGFLNKRNSRNSNSFKRLIKKFVFALSGVGLFAMAFCDTSSAIAAQKISRTVDARVLKSFVREYNWLEVNFSLRAHDLYVATPEGRKSNEDFNTFDQCQSFEYLRFWLKYQKLIFTVDPSPNVSPSYKADEILHDPKKIVVDIKDKVLTYLSDSGDVQKKLDASQSDDEFRRLELKFVRIYLDNETLQSSCKEFEAFRLMKKLVIGVPRQ
jgi:hypothetical protein